MYDEVGTLLNAANRNHFTNERNVDLCPDVRDASVLHVCVCDECVRDAYGGPVCVLVEIKNS